MVLHGHIGPRRLIRTFVAIPTPEDIVRRLMKLTQKFQWPGCKVRWSSPEQFHLTVQFLGNVEWIEVGKIGKTLKEVAAPFPPVTLSLTQLSVFPPRNQPRVIVAALEPNPTLLKLVETLQARLLADHQIVPESRHYKPHVTLGRVKSVADAEAGEQLRADLAAVDPDLLGSWGDWEADELTFFQSSHEDGRSEYIELAHAALGGARGGEEDDPQMGADEGDEEDEEDDENREDDGEEVDDEGEFTSGDEDDEPAVPARGARRVKTLADEVEAARAGGKGDEEDEEKDE
ncbi:MAG TPA: RNA 2',3'-cyclic phosphodiesterase [Planctomycetota bacterium]|nr:RNA 2',3'-cyclic phosphodiesterase [Planctomycetota bacterium]